MKKILAALILMVMMVTMVGCGNNQIIDTKWSFDTAVITVGNEVKTVKIAKWKDYEGGVVQVVDEDGNVYMTNYTNMVLIQNAAD
jgi:ABC-type glycerol-3-phosphate transport system substrate-binding protein